MPTAFEEEPCQQHRADNCQAIRPPDKCKSQAVLQNFESEFAHPDNAEEFTEFYNE